MPDEGTENTEFTPEEKERLTAMKNKIMQAKSESVTDEEQLRFKEKMKKIRDQFAKAVKSDPRRKLQEYEEEVDGKKQTVVTYDVECVVEGAGLELHLVEGGQDDGLLSVKFLKANFSDTGEVENVVNDQVWIKKNGEFQINKSNLDEKIIDQHQVTGDPQEAVVTQKTNAEIDRIGQILQSYQNAR
ncbi:MAG: hypothetical protein M1524_03390 [Patescibacteria group bacterium]|nr:hypothetical protein [Patescibacteria group bacterium]